MNRSQYECRDEDEEEAKHTETTFVYSCVFDCVCLSLCSCATHITPINIARIRLETKSAKNVESDDHSRENGEKEKERKTAKYKKKENKNIKRIVIAYTFL